MSAIIKEKALKTNYSKGTKVKTKRLSTVTMGR